MEWHWWHNWVYGWHAVSVGVHILAAVTLYFLLTGFSRRNLLALLVALIFVAHPVHNEAVVYVNSMGDSLASLLRFIQPSFIYPFPPITKAGLGLPFLLGVLVFFPLAMLSKETGFVLVGLLPLTDFLLLSKAKTFWGACQTNPAAAVAFYASWRLSMSSCAPQCLIFPTALIFIMQAMLLQPTPASGL